MLFSFNLISVSSLTKNLNSSITFYATHCEFEDLKTGQTIGGGRENNGLYILESRRGGSTTNEDGVLLWYHRLGHAPVQSLRIPSSNVRNNVKQLKCDTCQFAKSHKSAYPVNINKSSSFPFDLVYSDVWCAPLPSIYGNRYFVTVIHVATRCTCVSYENKGQSDACA